MITQATDSTLWLITIKKGILWKIENFLTSTYRSLPTATDNIILNRRYCLPGAQKLPEIIFAAEI